MRLFLEPKENYILLWNNSIAKPQEEKPMQNFGLLGRSLKTILAKQDIPVHVDFYLLSKIINVG